MVNCFDCIYDPMCGLASKMSKHTNISCNDFKAKSNKVAEITQGVEVDCKEGRIESEMTENEIG